jgi:hypothetical protein
MYICKYKGNATFEIKGSEEVIKLEYLLNNGVLFYALEIDSSYLVLEINKNLLVLPYKIDSFIEDSNMDISIYDIIILKSNGDIEINLQPLKKIKINGNNILTTQAVITSPSGACVITSDGQ